MAKIGTKKFVSNKPFWENESWPRIVSGLSPSFRLYLKEEQEFVLKQATMLHADQKVLDVGSGEGRTIDTLLASLIGEIHITGIDYVAANVAELQRKYANSQSPNAKVSIMQADIRALPKELGKFDLVILPFNLLGNLTRLEQCAALSNIEAALSEAPNARVIGSVYAENALPFQKECYSEYLGFKIEKTTKRHIYCLAQSGTKFRSQRFSAQQLTDLLLENGIRAERIEKPDLSGFTPFYYFYTARRQR